ncbi:Shikimate kinase [Corynebacterium cystitidis DSM 20524]|uniref:Shikimate kinase n=2 Tax=Corynebacterium cystitidis TaxID=35757 RepID=A0A1H9PFW5_9CORY|nr:Shikimate kinase [Corynebacterium cystitidis DSM 20524]SER46739.1 shikimate kinase [Corynebacterium cystitidis DSM 20524]SNV74878.1 shikimate kinase [Corynebacterium cystitidis]
MDQFDASQENVQSGSNAKSTIDPSHMPSHSVCHTTPKVVLVGPPGAGKSTIGRRLASATNLPLIDSDDLLAKGVKMPTGEYFSLVGEEKFREAERDYVSQALHTGGIVALGGGAVLTDEVRDMLQGHTVVWIDVSPEEGIRRTSRDNSRPVLAAQDPEAHYRALLEAREPFYREVADYRVRTDERPPQRVVAEILAIIDAD